MLQRMERLATNITEIFQAYLEAWSVGWRLPVSLFVAALILGFLLKRFSIRQTSDQSTPGPGWLALLLILGCMALGVYLTTQDPAMEDDSFISFRYAHNLVEGNGLVYNLGERVEGYTNFLWTILIAFFLWITDIEAPTIALALGLVCYLANVFIIYRIGRALAAPFSPRPYIPLAALLTAVQWLIYSSITTGLETLPASLLVNLGLWSLLTRRTPAGTLLTGAMFILATMTRPDHSLFYIAGGLAVLYQLKTAAEPVGKKGCLKTLAAYAAPFGAYCLYLAWKLSYYGSILPDTFYAKSVTQSYFDQGLTYAFAFFTGTHFWLVALLFLVWLFIPAHNQNVRVFKLFAALGLVFYQAFILQVGGDFLYGRFYVTLIPLMLLGAENLVYRLGSPVEGKRFRPNKAAIITGALLLMTAQGMPLLERGQVRWFIQNLAGHYFMKLTSPITMQHDSYIVGKFFKKTLTDRGIRPLLATGGIGMLGYYSQLPIFDIHGLIDPGTARTSLEFRGKPGHEKGPPESYLIRRGVDFRNQNEHPQRFRELTFLKMDLELTDSPWSIFTYDRELMARIKAEVPEIGSVDFELFLDDYLSKLDGKEPEQVNQDLIWFKRFYFSRNDDPRRLAALEDYIGQ